MLLFFMLINLGQGFEIQEKTGLETIKNINVSFKTGAVHQQKKGLAIEGSWSNATNELMNLLSHGTMFSNYLNFVFKVNNYTVNGIITKILVFDREGTNGNVETYVAIGYSNADLIIYKANMNVNDLGYLGPEIEDKQTGKFIEGSVLKYTAQDFFGSMSESYAITSLTYFPNVNPETHLFDKTKGQLLIGFGRTKSIFQVASPDIFSATFRYARQETEKGGGLAAVELSNLAGVPKVVTVLPNENDYGVANVYVIYQPINANQGSYNRAFVVESVATSQHFSMDVGFEIQNVGGIPIPIPTSGTLNFLQDFLNPFKKPVRDDVRRYSYFLTETGDAVHNVTTNKNSDSYDIPTNTLATSHAIFMGYSDGSLWSIHLGTDAIKLISKTPIQNIFPLDGAVIFQAFNEQTRTLIAATEHQMKFITFDETYDTLINHKTWENVDGIYPVIYSHYGNRTYIIMSDGSFNVFWYDSEVNDYQQLQLSSANTLFKSITALEVAEDGEVVYFAVANAPKVAMADVFLLTYDMNEQEVTKVNRLNQEPFDHQVEKAKFIYSSDNGKTPQGVSIEMSKRGLKGPIVHYGGKYTYHFDDREWQMIIGNNICESIAYPDDLQKNAWLTKGSCYPVEPF
ncbi:hypothetical protein [Cysteiniphilum sp. JM-1]|uniref:hypothetical protein n=1 Tax=Cysteiniphilum sp. JM-1 TaxID=2610891 RepID=UPI0012490045|nr:hypothetical protein [Cysteiniphilum sp. JM-1]